MKAKKKYDIGGRVERLKKKAIKTEAKANKKLDKLNEDRLDSMFGKRKKKTYDKGLRKLAINRAVKKARMAEAKLESAKKSK
tara:strand:- start:655 stop:900 length:246 start_codon:yes stop_codon:yes gene_type:complete